VPQARELVGLPVAAALGPNVAFADRSEPRAVSGEGQGAELAGLAAELAELLTAGRVPHADGPARPAADPGPAGRGGDGGGDAPRGAVPGGRPLAGGHVPQLDPGPADGGEPPAVGGEADHRPARARRRERPEEAPGLRVPERDLSPFALAPDDRHQRAVPG